MKLVPRTGRYVSYDQVVELLGIGHLMARRPAKLSGGEKQRVAIGRALLTSPSLLPWTNPSPGWTALERVKCCLSSLGFPVNFPFPSVSSPLVGRDPQSCRHGGTF